jgi:hypothetical protein
MLDSTALLHSEYADRVEPLVNWKRLLELIDKGNSISFKRVIVEQQIRLS